MKKLFTLVALLTVFMGANAANWQKVWEKNYSEFTGFPYYVMGYVPEWVDGVMTDYGAMFKYTNKAEEDAKEEGETSDVIVKTSNGTEYYKISLESPGWHQYFIADNIPTQMDGHYKVVAKVKASEAATINVNMGWGWGDGQQKGGSAAIPQNDEFQEVEWEYDGIGGTSCNLVAQPGGFTGTIEWESITVYEDAEGSRPVVWQQWLTNDGKPIVGEEAHENKWVGDAEFGAWPDWALATTDGINANWRSDRAPEICAWSLTMGKNFDDKCGDFEGQTPDRSRPYPTDIELEEGTDNHVFAVHVTQIDCIDDCNAESNPGASTAWSNQFWIQAPAAFKSGLSVRIKFRYKAEHACSAGTQWHKKNPSVYLDWNALGDVNFTETWQEFDKTASISDAANNAWSLAFNLCSDATNGRTANVFYFDDLSWESMKLDEGYFIAGINTNVTTKYENLNDAIQFEDGIDADQGNPCLVATVGTKGNDETWVNQVMISTVRGDNGAYMGSTLKPVGTIKNDPADWLDYSASSLAKLDLPGLGVWTVYLDTEYSSMAFQMIEGVEEEEKEPVDIVTNATEVTVKGQERAYTEAEAEAAGIDKSEATGQPWDNQFFLVANRTFKPGEVTVVKFNYKANKAATSSTQLHGAPGAYIHWAAIGSLSFEEDWLPFEAEYTIPNEAEGKDAQSIAFNMAEIKEACDYQLKDFQWYLKYDDDATKTLENLIDAEGTKNFFVKEGAGTNPYQYGVDPAGIENVAAKTAKTSSVIYNLAGQRVNNNFKGLVIKDGKKVVK